MTNNPTKKLDNIPIKNGIEKTNSVIFTKTAAVIIGVASKKENLAALSLSIFKSLATVIVIPERETPGKAAASA